MSRHHSIVIAGGGAAGLTVAARLLLADPTLDVAIVEPSEHHDYQPIWTLVGAGVVDRAVSRKAEADFIPRGATWIKDRVTGFDPVKNELSIGSGEKLGYDQLIVALGMKLDWKHVEGLAGNVGKDGICSNYSWDTVESTWKFLRDFRGGNAVFTFPSPPLKCAGAPQKIMYLADDHLRRIGVRSKSRVIYGSMQGAIFGVAKYRETLEKVVARKEIETHFQHELVAVKTKSREAVFRSAVDQKELSVKYDLLHVVPRHVAPDALSEGGLLGADGYVEVDPHSLQHKRHANVFSLGDVASVPTARTGAAVRKQAPVLVHNLLAARRGEVGGARYDGYSSCPLTTGYGKLVLAEFDYDSRPAESFPFDQAQERASMWMLKLHVLPELYWHGMLRGRA